jgi:hypothetical protein
MQITECVSLMLKKVNNKKPCLFLVQSQTFVFDLRIHLPALEMTFNKIYKNGI